MFSLNLSENSVICFIFLLYRFFTHNLNEKMKSIVDLHLFVDYNMKNLTKLLLTKLLLSVRLYLRIYIKNYQYG